MLSAWQGVTTPRRVDSCGAADRTVRLTRVQFLP